MNKRFASLKLIGVIVLAMIIALSPVVNISVLAKSSSDKIPDQITFLMQLEAFLKNNYVGEVKDLELLRGAIKGMMESLDDPYSEYFTPSEFQDFTENASGNFGGIGVVIITKDKNITAVSVLEGTPAHKAGIKPGDRFVEVNGENISSLSSTEVSKRLRGDKGTRVEVGVMREGEKQILRFELVRDIIKVNPIESKVLGQGIGYLKIGEFNENTVENLDKQLEHFKKSGVVGIVLDLRNNPGGLLDQTVEVANRFIHKGPVVNVVSKDGKVQTFYSHSEPYPFKIVVLVNGGSASAAEILAGAIKDRKVGTLVGEKTFGKATVQRTLHLGVLGGIKLTIAQYTTPNGTNINKTGITPDIVVKPDNQNPLSGFVVLKGDKKLQQGSIGLEVLGVQQRLKLLNIFNVQPDGVFGSRTLEAVKAFQRQKGLPVTGIVDAKFYAALDNAISNYLSSREDVQLRKAIDVLKAQLKSDQKAS